MVTMLIYDVIGAHLDGEVRHAEEVITSLGIPCSLSVPQSLYDAWWFFPKAAADLSNLPAYLSVKQVDPHALIGYGLSEESAKRISGEAG